MRRLRRHALPLLGLWGCLLLVYSNSFHSGFVFDNGVLLLEDRRIQAATGANLQLILTEPYAYKSSSSGLYRPLSTLSYLFNYAILGNAADPAGYHVINLLLHAVNAGLVYWLGLILFRGLVTPERPALGMAALWGLHPLLTESVTNMIGRADLLAAMGVLGGLICYVQATRGSNDRRRWILALALATTIAVFSKESGVVVLGAVALYELAFGDRPWVRKERLPVYLSLFIPVLVFLGIRAWVLGRGITPPFPFTDNPLTGAGFLSARLTALSVVGRYLGLFVWPGMLSCDYSYNQIPTVYESLAGWAGLAAGVALLTAVVVSYRRSRPAFFFIGLFLVTLAPVSNLVVLIGSVMAERFLYLPTIGLAGLLIWLLFSSSWSRRAPAILAIACIALAVRTYTRNFDWFDERSLWSSAAAASPESYKTHLHLALAIAGEKGEGLPQAAREIDRALAILDPVPDDRNVQQAYSTAGFVYRSLGEAQAARDPAQALRWYQRALDVLQRGERIDRTNAAQIRELSRQRHLTTAPAGWYPLYLELGDTYLRLSDPRNAMAAFEHGTEIDPAPELFGDLAYAYTATGEGAKAQITLWEGILANGDAPKLGAGLVNLYRANDPSGCALQNSAGGVSANMNCPMVHDQMCQAARNLADLYQRTTRSEQAAALRSRAGAMGCR